MFLSSSKNIFLIALDELLKLINTVIIISPITVDKIIIVKLLLKVNKNKFFV